MGRLLLILLAFAGCRREGGDPPVKPGPPPRHVAAVISIPSFDGLVRDLAALADAMTPGRGRRVTERAPEVLARAAEARSLDGYDPSRPVHAVVLAPPDRLLRGVLVVAVADRDRLSRALGDGVGMRVHGGWAVIGARADVEQVAPWVLHELVRRPAPRVPTALLHPSMIWNAIPTGRRLAQPDPGRSPQLTILFEALTSGLEQIERIDATFAASSSGAEVELRIAPRAGTAVASFAAAQRPSSFALPARLPPVDGAMYLMGHVVMGPLGPIARGLITSLGLAPLDTIAFGIASTFTGELALVLTEGATRGAYGAFAVDAAAPGRLASLSEHTRVEVRPDAVVEGGIRFSALEGLGDELQAFYGFDGDVGLLAGGVGASAHLAHMATSGAAPPGLRALPPRIAQLVDDAQASGASWIAIFDVGAATGRPPARDGWWYSLGAREGLLMVRSGISAAQLRLVAELRGP